MTTEEKAKAYDDALERARNYYKGLAPCRAKDELELIFHELAESEDEMALRIIRKRMCYDQVPISDEDRRIVENWLEKQKEQKPAEWGEEDEEHLNNILDAIDYWETTSGQGILLDTDINWLKSLRPSWKPSEEQTLIGN